MCEVFCRQKFRSGFPSSGIPPSLSILNCVYNLLWYIPVQPRSLRPENAPSYFQKSLAYVLLAGLLYLICEIYVNDLIVYGVDEDDFIYNFRHIFERLVKYKCVLKPCKCQFGLTKIEYVGRVLFSDGSTMRHETIQVIDFPLATRVKQLSSFIGLV